MGAAMASPGLLPPRRLILLQPLSYSAGRQSPLRRGFSNLHTAPGLIYSLPGGGKDGGRGWRPQGPDTHLLSSQGKLPSTVPSGGDPEVHPWPGGVDRAVQSPAQAGLPRLPQRLESGWGQGWGLKQKWSAQVIFTDCALLRLTLPSPPSPPHLSLSPPPPFLLPSSSPSSSPLRPPPLPPSLEDPCPPTLQAPCGVSHISLHHLHTWHRSLEWRKCSLLHRKNKSDVTFGEVANEVWDAYSSENN